MSAVPSAVTDFFEVDAANWDAYYRRQDVFSVIHQLRFSLVLAWVDELRLPVGSRVLDVGCGTGLMAIALAQRGLQVTAVDSAAGMLARAEANVASSAGAAAVTLLHSSAERLPLPSDAFELVVALGLVPWVPSPRDAVAEMIRTLVPGGRLIVNCDNRRRLSVLLDPRYAPALAGLRVAARRLRSGRPVDGDGATTVRHGAAEFDALLVALGTRVERGMTFGYGPFTFLGREVLPARLGVAVHRGLQSLAERGIPGVRSTGAQYLVRAVKS